MHSPMINNKEFRIVGLFCGLLLHHEYGTLIVSFSTSSLSFLLFTFRFPSLLYFNGSLLQISEGRCHILILEGVSVGRSNRDKKTTINKAN